MNEQPNLQQYIQPLPKDGAAFHCTFTQDGQRCGKVTKVGLTLEFYDMVTPKLPDNIHIMRALCIEHVDFVKEVTK